MGVFALKCFLKKAIFTQLLPLSCHMLLEDLAGDDQVFAGNLRRALWVLPFVLGDLLPLGAIFV